MSQFGQWRNYDLVVCPSKISLNVFRNTYDCSFTLNSATCIARFLEIASYMLHRVGVMS